MKEDYCLEENASTPEARERLQSTATTGTGDMLLVGDNVISKADLDKIIGVARGKTPRVPNRFGNPTPLGLASFALTCFFLSLVNANARGVTNVNLIISLAFFYGGVAQFMAGMWGFANGETFTGVAFGSYGPFWMSFAAINTNAFGIQEAYKDSPQELANCLGFYIFGWFIFTIIMMLCILRTTVMLVGMFFILNITFLLLACGNMLGNEAVIKAGGITGLITAFMAWYNAYGMIRDPETTMAPFWDMKTPW